MCVNGYAHICVCMRVCVRVPFTQSESFNARIMDKGSTVPRLRSLPCTKTPPAWWRTLVGGCADTASLPTWPAKCQCTRITFFFVLFVCLFPFKSSVAAHQNVLETNKRSHDPAIVDSEDVCGRVNQYPNKAH